jgi:hypothetical protein
MLCNSARARERRSYDNGGQAAETSLLIARQEQLQGNYKMAHELLFRAYQVAAADWLGRKGSRGLRR